MKEIWQGVAAFIQSSLRYKLIVSLIGAIIIPLLLSVYTSYILFRRAQVEDSVVNNTNLLSQSSRRLDDYFEKLDDPITVIENDYLLSNTLNNFDADKKLHTKKLQAVSNLFNKTHGIHTLLIYYPLVKEAFVIGQQSHEFYKDAQDFEHHQWYNELMDAKNDDYLVQSQHYLEEYANRYRVDKNQPVITISRALRRILGSNVYVVVSVSYNLDTLKQFCREIQLGGNETIGLVSQSGEYFCSVGPAFLLPGDILEQINAAGYKGHLQFRTESGINTLLI